MNNEKRNKVNTLLILVHIIELKASRRLLIYVVISLCLTDERFCSNRRLVGLSSNIHLVEPPAARSRRVGYIQGGPAKVRPIYFLMVTFECIGEIQ